jgi:hypothetical protein
LDAQSAIGLRLEVIGRASPTASSSSGLAALGCVVVVASKAACEDSEAEVVLCNLPPVHDCGVAVLLSKCSSLR